VLGCYQKPLFLGGCLVTWFSMLHSGYNLDTIKEDYYRDPPLSIHLKNNFPLPSCVAFNVIENSIHPSTTAHGGGAMKLNNALKRGTSCRVYMIVVWLENR